MLIFVPLTQIDDNPFQARQEYGDTADLAGRIAAARDSYPETYGLMQIPRGRVIFRNAAQPAGAVLSPAKALTLTDKDRVMLPDTAVRVQLAFGHRRLRAFRHLWANQEPGYTRGVFPVQVSEFTDEQMLDAVWAENRERKDISAVEEAELLARKLERASSQREVASAWGVDRSTVANRLRLLELPAEIQQANRDGRLSERACLALAPVVDVQTRTNGSVKWGSTQAHWGPPIAPAAFIEKAINDPKMTSDAIREYAKRAVEHAGQPLAKLVADMRLDVEGARQPLCQGCPMRINTTCLRPECLHVKEAAAQAAIIADAETVLGIPFSDRPEDFELDFEQYKALKALWESGQQRPGTNFVFGWVLGKSAFRPFTEGAGFYKYASGSDLWQGDGRYPIVIGHRGNLPLHMLPGDQAASKHVADIATKEDQAAWAKEAKKILKDADKAVRAAVVDAIYLPFDGLSDIMQAVIRKPDQEWVDEYETMLGLFVEYVLKNAPGYPGYLTDWRDLERIRTFLSRAGLDGRPLSAAADPRREAVMALHLWYSRRPYGSWGWEDCRGALKGALAWFAPAGPLGEEMDTLRDELRRALRDMDAKLAYEAEVEADRAARRAAQAQVDEEEETGEYDEEDTELLGWLSETPQTVAEIAAATGLSQGEVAEQLTGLALEGIAVEVYSGAYALIS
ncbi:MAG: ParB/RepB/Spo0J family partition protein [Chloroflexi bacterium]|nr:ParB/RepB/Spo0J family partition protein [Chloroflexota bacterium]MBP7041736.1 ParB/RepB/Spo0J family partition protein [Chloroflexota bacterium]